MKTTTISTVVVALSLAGNAALGFALAHRAPNTSVASTSPQSKSTSSKTIDKDQSTMPSTRPFTSKHGSTKFWDSLNSSDPAILVANLRKAGFSPKLIREIVQNLVYKKHHSRLMEAYGYSNEMPYWKASEGFSYDSPKGRTIRGIHRETEREVRSLLGPDYFADDESSLYRLRQYGNIPAAKIARLTDIQEDYEELTANISTGSATLPADREKLKLLEKEQRADVEKLLTPEELFEYDLRNSTVSSQLRGWDQMFDMTETEFRALFPLYQTVEKQFPSDSGIDNQRERKEAEAKIQDQIKTLLGDTRYAEYKQSQSQEARQENRLVVRLGFPLTAATQLVDAKKEFRDQARKISGKKDLTDEQKKEQLSVLLQTAEGRVTAVIGERGLSIYRDYGGSWLKAPSDLPAKKPAP